MPPVPGSIAPTSNRPAVTTWQGPQAAARRPRRGVPWFAYLLGGCLTVIVLLVLLCAGVAGVIGGLAWRLANQHGATDTTDQTLTVSGVPSLTVDSDVGSVRIISGPAHEVRVSAARRVTADSPQAARDLMRQISVQVHQSGDDVSVTAHSGDGTGLGSSLSTDLTVAVPQAARIVLRLGAGGAEIDNIAATLYASLRQGDLRLSGVTLQDASTLDVGHGNVTLSAAFAPAATLSIHDAAGNVSATWPRDTALRLDASTAAGALTSAGLDATPQVRGNGSALATRTLPAVTTLTTAAPASLTIRVDAGDITLRAA